MKASLYGSWFCIVQRPQHLGSVLSRAGFNIDVYTSGGLRKSSKVENPSAKIHRSILLSKRFLSLAAVGPVVKNINNSMESYIFSKFLKSKSDIYIHQKRPFERSTYIPNLKGPLIYDCVDDWEGFTGADSRLPFWETELCERADQIWVVSRHLQEKLNRWEQKIRYVPNGVDFSHFSDAPNYTTQTTQKKTRRNLTYIGAIFNWFDARLVSEVSKLLYDWDINLYGPQDLSVEQLKWLDRPNIKLHGKKSYSELPKLLADADVAMIPFLINDLIRGTSPIKLYEYLAAGVPVVATPMPEVLPYAENGVVGCAERPIEFASLAQSLAENANPNRCQEIARSASWDSRFLPALEDALGISLPRFTSFTLLEN